ncbi:MAG: DUF3168 domain-containing protein [Rhabdaerophilum sp.]
MSVPHPIVALKEAIRARLLATNAVTTVLGQGVHDAPPRGAEPPYLVLGDALLRENGTSEAEGFIAEIDLVAITRERGTRSALQLAEAIESALMATPLAIHEHHASLLFIRETIARHDEAKSLSRVTLRLRANLYPL